MMRPQPLVTLHDVEAGSRWFQAVLGLESGHGGPDYEMLMDGDDMVAQLHRWDADDHEHLGDAGDASRGNGIVLWFATDDFEAMMERVGIHHPDVLEGPLLNENAGQREIWLRGPEGYTVAVAGPRSSPPAER